MITEMKKVIIVTIIKQKTKETAIKKANKQTNKQKQINSNNNSNNKKTFIQICNPKTRVCPNPNNAQRRNIRFLAARYYFSKYSKISQQKMRQSNTVFNIKT